MVLSLVGNAIKMALLLKSRGKMKGADLAKELEVSERQIRQYRDDLEQAGIFIQSTTGKYGGYVLQSSENLSFGLQENELMVLEMINEQLRYNNDLYAKEFTAIVDKVRASINSTSKQYERLSYFTVQPKANIDQQEEKKKYQDIYFAYIGRYKVKMQYQSLTSGIKERVVEPYGLYHYKGDLYMVAFCELKQKFLDFKLCRIKEYEVLQEKYPIDHSFSWKKYSENTLGIYKDKEIDLLLKVSYPYSMIVKEKVWVDNQIIQEEADGSILLRAKMKGYQEIKSWILSMGVNAEVIQPKELREEIASEMIDTIKKYQ